MAAALTGGAGITAAGCGREARSPLTIGGWFFVVSASPIAVRTRASLSSRNRCSTSAGSGSRGSSG
jgi:hypothetical protein